MLERMGETMSWMATMRMIFIPVSELWNWRLCTCHTQRCDELVTAVALLDRRALHGAVGAVDAAVAGLGLEDGAAAFAVIEILAGVRGHRLRCCVTAGRTA